MEENNRTERAVAYRIAVATSDGLLVNRHFGHAERFDIYAAHDDLTFRKEEERALPPVCRGGEHSDAIMRARVEALRDCQCVLVSRIGLNASVALEQEGLAAYELPGYVEESLDRVIRYRAVESLLI